MTDFKSLAQMRRSHRKFTSEEIDPEALKLILRAALMSPTSKSQRAWHFVVVDDKTDLEKLADAKNMGSQFLKDAPVAIVVLGDPMQNDCWVVSEIRCRTIVGWKMAPLLPSPCSIRQRNSDWVPVGSRCVGVDWMMGRQPTR